VERLGSFVKRRALERANIYIYLWARDGYRSIDFSRRLLLLYLYIDGRKNLMCRCKKRGKEGKQRESKIDEKKNDVSLASYVRMKQSLRGSARCGSGWGGRGAGGSDTISEGSVNASLLLVEVFAIAESRQQLETPMPRRESDGLSSPLLSTPLHSTPRRPFAGKPPPPPPPCRPQRQPRPGIAECDSA
jgi:hypothetical protein